MSTIETSHRLMSVCGRMGLLILVMVLVLACGFFDGADSEPGETLLMKEEAPKEEFAPTDDGGVLYTAEEPAVEKPAADEAVMIEVEKEVEALALMGTAAPALESAEGSATVPMGRQRE